MSDIPRNPEYPPAFSESPEAKSPDELKSVIDSEIQTAGMEIKRLQAEIEEKKQLKKALELTADLTLITQPEIAIECFAIITHRDPDLIICGEKASEILDALTTSDNNKISEMVQIGIFGNAKIGKPVPGIPKQMQNVSTLGLWVIEMRSLKIKSAANKKGIYKAPLE